MRWIWYCTLLAYIAFLLGLIYTIIIDYDDKNPVKTICWILVVLKSATPFPKCYLQEKWTFDS